MKLLQTFLEFAREDPQSAIVIVGLVVVGIGFIALITAFGVV